MQVGRDATILFVGGEDHQLRIPFLSAMRQRGFRVVATGSADPRAFAHADLEYHAFSFDRFINPRSDVAAIRDLSAIIRRVGPDIVQSFDLKPNFMSAFAVRGRSLVVRTINGLGWLFSSRSPGALGLRPLYFGLQRLAASYTSATVFQNSEDHAFFARNALLGRGPSLVIPGSGIDVGGFEDQRRNASHPDILRRELGLEGAKVIITVSRLTKQKGIPTLLTAAEMVHQADPRARFLLVGSRETEGPFAVGAQDIERHADYVLALGHRQDVAALIDMADVFAFPTEYREGVPRALLEAGLAGLPIVATRMPGCSDVVVDGWNGFLVAPGAPRELADRILELLRDPARAASMGRNARTFVAATFNLNAVADSYARLYADLLQKQGGSTAP